MRQIFIFLLLAGVLAGIYFYGFSGSKNPSLNIESIGKNISRVKKSLEAGRENSSSSSEASLASSSSISAESNQGEEAFRQSVMKVLESSLKNVVAQTFPIGEEIQIQRFWFANEGNVYVDYKDDGQPREVLIEILNRGRLNFRAVGYFLPGEGGWVLKKGEDKIFANPQRYLYEFNPHEGLWEKRNNT